MQNVLDDLKHCELEEEWRDIEGFPGYQVSSLGRVRSFKDFHGNITNVYRVLKPCINKDGYYELSLYTIDHKQVTKRIHKLTADAFLGHQDGKVVNHIDTNKLNNIATNLEWVTAEENSTLAAEAGLYKTRAIKIIETGEIFNSIKDCANAINANTYDINHYFSGRVKHVKDLHFEYIDDKPKQLKKREVISKPFLYDYQMDAVKRMHNGCILCGSVGSGKSRTGLYYYFKECGGWIDEYGYQPMKKPKDLIIISTAKKRDSLEWLGELSHFLLYPDKDGKTRFGNTIIVDSWNNLPKYKDLKNCFFLLDEQRLVSYGAWTKAFLEIAKYNDWILLSATPADTYSDYLPVFLANGFYKNKTEFGREHIVYSRYSKYPKIDKYVNTVRLDRLVDKVLVVMDYHHDIKKINEDVYCTYDISKYKKVIRDRWDIYNECPLQDAGGLCRTLRRVVNSDESRQVKLLEILENHPRAIIFYNHNFERDILLNLAYGEGVEVAEWTGHAHQPVPDSEKWVYICQYTSACEGWNCIKTNCIIFYSQSYSYKVMTQAAGRVDRLNTPFDELYYYHLKSRSGIDLAISKALSQKKKFNERKFAGFDK